VGYRDACAHRPLSPSATAFRSSSATLRSRIGGLPLLYFRQFDFKIREPASPKGEVDCDLSRPAPGPRDAGERDDVPRRRSPPCSRYRSPQPIAGVSRVMTLDLHPDYQAGQARALLAKARGASRDAGRAYPPGPHGSENLARSPVRRVHDRLAMRNRGRGRARQSELPPPCPAWPSRSADASSRSEEVFVRRAAQN